MRNRKVLYSIYLLFVCTIISIASLSFFSCAGKSEEDLLLETIDKIGDYAEDRDSEGILLYLSGEYNDQEGRNFADIEKLLNTYLGKYRGIAVNLLAKKITAFDIPDAEVEVEVSLSSGAAKLFRKALRYSGQFYRFNLEFVKKREKWECISASWKYIPLDELFPESFKILKKLFPGSF